MAKTTVTSNIDVPKDLLERKVPTYSKQQLEISRKMDYYLGEQHDWKKYDWEGRPINTDDEWQVITTGIFPGRALNKVANIPLKLRRPTIRLETAKMIVNRFTSLLFGNGSLPTIKDPNRDGQLFIDEILTEAFWRALRNARNTGGATGLAIVGFHFENGQLQLDLYDPRFTFVDGNPYSGEVKQVELIYYFVKTVEKLETYNNETHLVQRDETYVARTILNDRFRVVFEDLPAEEAEKVGIWTPKEVYAHSLGFVPVIFVQNIPRPSSLVGEGDFEGSEPLMDAVDMELSQSDKGILYNSDPTLVLATDKEVTGSITKGSENAIIVGQGDDAKYLSLDHGGPELGIKFADQLMEQIYDQCQVVINPGNGNMTAEEVRHRFEAMYDKVDILRAQYGEGIHRLLTLIAKAANTMQSAGMRFELPMPAPEEIQIEWPEYNKPTYKDKESTIRQLAVALDAGMITKKVAIEKAAKTLGVKDIADLVEELLTANTGGADGGNN